jgi:hypothetical protein
VTVVSLSNDGLPEVELEPGRPPVSARLAIKTTRSRLELAVADRQQAVVAISDEPLCPVILGFLEPVSPDLPAASLEPHPSVEADVDGRRVRVTAKDEIVFECGQASITLRRNGRVIIRGTYVESQSAGTNRIKGGQVQIN